MRGKILLGICQFDSVISSSLFSQVGDHISQLSTRICLTDSNESGDKIISGQSAEYFMMLAKAIDSKIAHSSPGLLFAIKSFAKWQNGIQALSFADANSATKTYAWISIE